MTDGKRALIIGINDYPSCPLNGCLNDANEVSKLFEVNQDGSPNFEVRKILDIKTKGEFKGQLKELFRGSCKTELFYFSGHGFLNELGGYIVTPDYAQNDEGVSMQEILQLAHNSNSANRIIILDCCHSGQFGNSTIIGSNYATINEGLTILTASRNIESAVEINGHGLFTSLFIEALKGGAADLTGHISPGSIYAFIDKALGHWEQRPVFKTNITKFTSLREVKPPISMEVLRNISLYFGEPENEMKLNPSFEFTNNPTINHDLIEPYADEKNIKIFKDIQQMESVGLVIPVGEEHMYFAAMKSKSCKLTSLGHHYWRLIKERKI